MQVRFLRTGTSSGWVVPVWILVAAVALTGQAIMSSPVGAAEILLNGHTFTVPEGFDLQQIAGPPLVERPITADFDDQGRLYVGDSSGSNDKIQVQLENKPHRIVRLEDSDGDGVFDKSTVFADRMMFPEGTMWHDGSLYVSAPPSIWKLTDTDGDGIADERTEFFQGKTLTGCANDLHGPYLGLDGWIYWCKGAFAEQTHQIHGREWKSKASHIFRCRPDGSRLEPVMTGGMDNPVDVVFLPNGERFFTTTFLVHPGNGQRDGILHNVYGGVYGKEQGALEGHARTGELMPVLCHMGAAAPCGLVRYDSDSFGGEYRDNLFACQFNLHRVSRHILQPAGATYRTQDSDFVVSSNLDFHPTDVIEDAEGNIVIVDTGGWYKLCCPTSQLWKPDILGAVYRVSRKGARRLEDPLGKSIAWESVTAAQLVRLAIDDRRAVRRRAALELARRSNSTDLSQNLPELPAAGRSLAGGNSAASAFSEKERTAHSRLLWALTQTDHEWASRYIRESLATIDDETVRQVALHSISLRRDKSARAEVRRVIDTGTPMNRRAAAEALGRLGEKAAVTDLLQAAIAASMATVTGAAESGAPQAETPAAVDRFLEHSIIYALVELADPEATAAGLSSDDPHVRRVALIALDQMPGGGLTPEQVTPLLASDNHLIKETSHWIISHHPEWGGQLAGFFSDRLSSLKESPTVDRPTAAELDPFSSSNTANDLEQQLTRFHTQETIQSLLAEVVLDEARFSIAARQLVLRVMGGSKPKEVPESWRDALAKLIAQQSARLSQDTALEKEKSARATSLLAAAVTTAHELPASKKPHAGLNDALKVVAIHEELPETIRLEAMAAVSGGIRDVSEPQFQLLLASLLPDNPVRTRSSAADAISRATLSVPQLDRLAESIVSVGPLELDRMLVPFEHASDEQIGLKLVASLKQSLSLSSLRQDSLQQRLGKYSPTVQQGVAELVSLINAEAAQQKARIEQLLPLAGQGDVRRGQAVFNSAKAACTACHRFGYLGGNDGPDLTRIGGIRTERDLLESILYPSLSFVRSYEPVLVVTVDGRILNGLIRDESSSKIVLTVGPNQVVHLARDDVEDMRPSTVSVMPAGLDRQLTEQELADLVAFLRNAK